MFCLLIFCVLVFFIFQRETKVTVLRWQQADALKEGCTLPQQRDSLIGQRDREYRQRDLALSRLDRAEQR